MFWKEPVFTLSFIGICAYLHILITLEFTIENSPFSIRLTVLCPILTSLDILLMAPRESLLLNSRSSLLIVLTSLCIAVLVSNLHICIYYARIRSVRQIHVRIESKNGMTKQKRLGQYFTPSEIAHTLVSQLQSPVTKVIELGAGQGALARAISERFPDSDYVGVEIDDSARSGFHAPVTASQNIIAADVFNEKQLSSFPELAEADTVVGNPPFISSASTTQAQDIINNAFPSLDYSQTKSLRAEVYFLAASINRLANNGQASFILPISFFTSPTYSQLRYDLASQYSDIAVIQLPAKVFSNAEVESCILKFKKAKGKSQTITVAQANLLGEVTDKLEVPKKDAIKRMDYTFNKVAQMFQAKAAGEKDTFGSLGGEISRGSASRANLEKSQLTYFHTTSFPEKEHAVNLGFNEVNRFRHARTGDILVPRVGSRCLDRQVHVAEGQQVYTDCVYKLSVADELMDRVMKTLSSDFGRAWRLSHANGKCAKFITNSTLLEMPLLD